MDKDCSSKSDKIIHLNEIIWDGSYCIAEFKIFIRQPAATI